MVASKGVGTSFSDCISNIFPYHGIATRSGASTRPTIRASRPQTVGPFQNIPQQGGFSAAEKTGNDEWLWRFCLSA
jgi:hypothetical protein